MVYEYAKLADDLPVSEVKRVGKWCVALALACVHLTVVSPHSFADMHLARKSQLLYDKGFVGFSVTDEVWASENLEYRNFDHHLYIIRRDLKKLWNIDLAAKTYIESAFDPEKPRRVGGPEQPQESEKTRGEEELQVPEEPLHNEGYVYEPEYDWSIKETTEKKLICGAECRKFVIEGDADYSEETIELWVADDVPIDKQLYAQVLDLFLSSQADSVVQRFEELRGCFVLHEKIVTDDPIAPVHTWESEVTTAKDEDPPAGIYELPPGLRKVEKTPE